jgi:hypothetical protein
VLLIIWESPQLNDNEASLFTDYRDLGPPRIYLSHLFTYLHRSSVYGTLATESTGTGSEDSHEVEQSIHH